jgi:signal transduction histidine kinase
MGDATTLLELLLASAQALTAAAGALVVQLQREDAIVVSVGGAATPLRGRRVFLPGTALDRALEHREPVVLADAADLLGGTEEALRGAAIAVPLTAHGQALGALVVTRASAAFTAHERHGLGLVADFVALALWKARLVEEATSATQAKSTFLATMSHELRTPLTTLTGYLELLEDQIFGPLPPAQLDVVERMRAVTQALATTIDEILTYSSIEAGREVARLRETSGAELLRATHAMVQPIARLKGLQLGLTLHDEPATVCTDPDKVRQILLNLAGNGVKFTDQGGVHLSLARENGALHFAVRDTGTGIPEEDQARLFQPFTQLDGGLTRRHGGTGLGLYISHRLAVLLGGRIEVESVPGNGSTFTLVLPASS